MGKGNPNMVNLAAIFDAMRTNLKVGHEVRAVEAAWQIYSPPAKGRRSYKADKFATTMLTPTNRRSTCCTA
jgi:hypothetical protein